MKLHTVANDIKYWVIRPGNDAVYFRHFMQNSVVALGHIDDVIKEEGVIKSVEPSDIFTALKSELDQNRAQEDEASDKILTDEEARKESAQITSAVTQVKTFINDLKVGDVVITLNSSKVLVGTIKSDAYIEEGDLKALLIDGSGYSSKILKYKLRRNVEWESPRNRETIPKPIKPSLGPSQTLFSISEDNSELFTHWLYSIFLQNGRLYFSTKIDQRNKISQFNVTEFQRTIQKLELLATKIASKDFDGNLFNEIEEQYIYSGIHNEFSLVTKNSFLSPGNIWSDVGGEATKLAVFAVLLGGLFGVNVEASEEFTEEQKVAINQTVKEMKETGKGNFDVFQASIKASLDKPNKSIKQVSEDTLDGKKEITFPKVKADGDTGI
ncbi:hypothetical protein CWB60_16735 [Pseudoalteromonas sp. S327]|uniref:hypothetical protein n=1 Tax=unclassified Pseudoalteromonas TaxID=194690 RepID=UPI00110B2147|nr:MULTISPECIES: hypothetical protein [unclassified Pseudoalteromonas]TMO04304.1 hypothetical protein CWB60_16735 [Pseudoalteromonas sp. S327]TMO15205.1 hypothetical protein CWB59_15950 [Pseudoalteromonas sp. S326]